MAIAYMPLYVADYEADTAHLSVEEDGAYSRLLRLCWRTEGCTIPADDEWIMRRLRVDRETFDRAVKPVLDEFFKTRRNRYYNPRLSREHSRIKTVSQTRAENGRKGGRPAKALKDNENDKSKRLANGKQNESIYNQNQNYNQNYKNSPSESVSAPPGYPDDFERFWSAYPSRSNNPKKPAFAAWQSAKRNGVDPETMIRGAAGYAAYCRDQSDKDNSWHDGLIAHARTWLTQARWEEFSAAPSRDARSVAEILETINER